jgi:hypothetical protein
MYLLNMLIIKDSRMEVITWLEELIPAFERSRCDKKWNFSFCNFMNNQEEIMRNVAVVVDFGKKYQQ